MPGRLQKVAALVAAAGGIAGTALAAEPVTASPFAYSAFGTDFRGVTGATRTAESSVSAAATIRLPAEWSASLVVNYLGKRSGLYEETSLRASTFVNGRLTRNLTANTRLTLDVFNVFDQHVRDIDYFSASRMGSLPGVADNYLFNPAEPRGFRVRLRTTF